MAEWQMQVTRTVTLAIKAPTRAEAEEDAFSQAWEWQPESASGGDQGSVSLRVMPDG